VSWIGAEGHVLFTLPFFGEQFQITKQLVRTAAGLASFSARYYAVASAVYSTNRDEFIASRSSCRRRSARGQVP